ncbi:hypothetical protein KCU98_g7098, partial [Aureobasidium melanogenum]
MTGVRSREMVPDHDNNEPQQPLSGEMRFDHQHNHSNQCDCCFETVSSKKTVQLPGCGHTYCADCLRVMYRMATSNEAHFPPSCCSGAINIATVKHLLHRPQLKAFERCAAEYGTPVLGRRYCADTRCNSFLGRANGGILRCGKCGNLTCDSCKDYAHPGACKEERGRDIHKLDADLERLAAAEGWQRCPSCSRIIVLGEGCNHITLVSPCQSSPPQLTIVHVVADASTNSAMSVVPSGRPALVSNGKMLVYKNTYVAENKLQSLNHLNSKSTCTFWKCVHADWHLTLNYRE